MTERSTTTLPKMSAEPSRPAGNAALRPGWLAAAGLLGALAASTCCLLPLALFAFGITGAWMGTVTALAPYQPVIIPITLGLLLAGYVVVYQRRRSACASDAACERPAAGWLIKGALWAATALVAGALALPYILRLAFSG